MPWLGRWLAAALASSRLPRCLAAKLATWLSDTQTLALLLRASPGKALVGRREVAALLWAGRRWHPGRLALPGRGAQPRKPALLGQDACREQAQS